MRVMINLGATNSWPWLNQSKRLGICLKGILESLVMVDQYFLNLYEVRPLYETGVRYRNEPEGKAVFIPSNADKNVDAAFGRQVSGQMEEAASIPAILARGWGDCDDLAPWRVAELRRQGEKAKIRVQWKKDSNVKLFHIVVRREDGSIEDPSKVLGMHEPHWKNPRLYM